MSIERRDDDVEVLASRRTIVTALPLKPAARERLAELLDARVFDIRDQCEHPDVVLTPVCSPQLIGALRRRYEGAQVVIVELDDWEFDVALHGPVKRLLRSGAAAYVLADSIDELAAKIDSGAHVVAAEPDEVGTIHELTAQSTVDEVIAAFLRESVEYAVRHRPDDA